MSDEGKPARQRIVIGYDGSPNSEDALELGRQLCEAFDAIPLVASCVLWPRYLMDPPELGRAVEDDTRPLLAHATEKLAPLGVQTCSLYGDSAAMALQQLALDVEALAIVVGSSHRGAAGRVLLGSTGRSLLTGSPSALAVAPKRYAEHRGEHLLRIGVGVDGGEEAAHALETGIALAERLHAKLTLVGVLTPTPVGYGTVAGSALGDLARSQREHFAQVLEDAADSVPASLSVEVRRLQGAPAQRLAEASADFDLMVVGSRGYGPLRRVMLGSVSSSLMEAAACPLLITPKGASLEPPERDGAASGVRCGVN